MAATGSFKSAPPLAGPVSHVTAKEIAAHSGESGIFGEIFIGLGLLILLGGIALAVLKATHFFDHSPVGATAANNDAFVLWFLLAIEGVGFTVFGVMCLVAGWDRAHHPDMVH
jgi:hypothetical protein